MSLYTKMDQTFSKFADVRKWKSQYLRTFYVVTFPFTFPLWFVVTFSLWSAVAWIALFETFTNYLAGILKGE